MLPRGGARKPGRNYFAGIFMLETRPDCGANASAGDDNVTAAPQAHAIKPEFVAGPVKERRHAAFFDVIRSSLAIGTPEQFCAWAQGDLQHIFPHGMLACGIGLIENSGGRFQNLITCNFPQEYIQTLQRPDGLTTSPILAQWTETRRPVLFELPERHGESAWLHNFEHYGLHNMAAHGLSDLHSRTTSYFSFANIAGKLTPRHADLLEMLVPHLHMALTRAVNGVEKESHMPKAMLPCLTEREHEILQWLGSGKTNWEIAQVLCISENTVKNHVQRILVKLKVNTRAQAAVKGLFPAYNHQA